MIFPASICKSAIYRQVVKGVYQDGNISRVPTSHRSCSYQLRWVMWGVVITVQDVTWRKLARNAVPETRIIGLRVSGQGKASVESSHAVRVETVRHVRQAGRFGQARRLLKTLATWRYGRRDLGDTVEVPMRWAFDRGGASG